MTRRAKLTPRVIQKVKTMVIKVLHWRPQSLLECLRKGSENEVAKKRFRAGNTNADGSEMGSTNRKAGGIFEDYCNDFLNPFLRYLLNRFFSDFGIDLYIICMLYWDVVGCIFETS